MDLSTAMSDQPAALSRWHAVAESKNPALLDDLLADDVVFRSPAVFAPVEGKALTSSYLSAALKVLGQSARGAPRREFRELVKLPRQPAKARCERFRPQQACLGVVLARTCSAEAPGNTPRTSYEVMPGPSYALFGGHRWKDGPTRKRTPAKASN